MRIGATYLSGSQTHRCSIGDILLFVSQSGTDGGTVGDGAGTNTKDGTGGMRPFVRNGEATKYVSIGLMNGGGKYISRVDTRLKPHVEPLTSHLKGTSTLDGVVDAENI